MHQLYAAVALLGVSVLLWGCQSAPSPEPEPTPPETPTEEVVAEPEINLPPAEALRTAIALLQEGDAAGARLHLQSYIREVPDSRMARNLLAQIDTPINEYFPAEHFNVKLARGETLSSLARAYLGDALAFHALARYNGISKPAQVIVGQSIRIPQTEAAIAARDRAQAESVAPDDSEPAKEITEAPTDVAEPPKEEVETAPTDATADQRDEEVRPDLLTRAEAAAEAGEFESALDLVQQARQTSDDPAATARIQAIERRVAEFHYQQAVSAFSRQDLGATIHHADAVLDIDPQHTNARLYKARALELQSKLEALSADQDG